MVVDGARDASVRYGQGFADTHRIERGALLTRWADLRDQVGAHGAISGITRPSDLPVVLQLVATHGARVAFSASVGEHGLDTLLQRMRAGLGPVACARADALPRSCREGALAGWPAHAGAVSWLGWVVEYGTV